MQTLFDLLKSLVNATLILVAICLFLGWKGMQSAEGVTANLKDTVEAIRPITDQIIGLRDDVTTLQAHLQSRGDEGVSAELAELNTKLDNIQTSLSRLNELPERLSETVAIATLEGLKRATARLHLQAPAKPDTQ